MNLLKPCIKCGVVNRMKNGKCKPCYAAYPSKVKRLSASKREQLTKEQALERSRKRIIDWTARNPEKTAAHREVYKALKKKAIQKLPCLVCGEKSEAHHPDYSRPLDVMWLCRTHHKQTHALAA